MFYFTNRALAKLLTVLQFSVETNASQFANTAQVLEVLDARGDINQDIIKTIARDLAEICAGTNSFVVARKPSSYRSTDGKMTTRGNDPTRRNTISISGDRSFDGEYGFTLSPHGKGQRVMHFNKTEVGPWQIVFPIQNKAKWPGRGLFLRKRYSSTNHFRIFVSGNIIVFKSNDPIRIELLDSSNSNSRSNTASVENNRSLSFSFSKDTQNISVEKLKIAGKAPAEFIIYDLNFSAFNLGLIDSTCFLL